MVACLEEAVVSARLRDTQEKTARLVHQALFNDAGSALLEEMEAQFPGRFHVDPCQHAFAAGQRDVVLWLKEKLDFQER